MNNIVDGYVYNHCKTIRTKYNVERLFSTDRGFIGLIWDVEYLRRNDGEWFSVGSRWLVNTDNVIEIIESGFKNFPEVK
jgi:hypothetical protein